VNRLGGVLRDPEAVAAVRRLLLAKRKRPFTHIEYGRSRHGLCICRHATELITTVPPLVAGVRVDGSLFDMGLDAEFITQWKPMLQENCESLAYFRYVAGWNSPIPCLPGTHPRRQVVLRCDLIAASPTAQSATTASRS